MIKQQAYLALNDAHGPSKKAVPKPARKRRAHKARGPPELTLDQRRGQELISFDELHLLYGIRLSRVQIKRLVAAKQFPQPVRLSSQRIAFVRAEIEAWIAERLAARAAE
jgi:predicted DNA-binding transcriptional regulator AlpA